MLDIDHFKQVNDTFGHLAGDEVLKQMGCVLSGCLRGNDVVCRYGGEEFMLLLTGSGLDEAIVVAERLRLMISETVRLPCGQHITVSAGCSEFIAGEDESHFLKRADDAMYAAKAMGRNCVCAARMNEAGEEVCIRGTLRRLGSFS